MTMREKIARAMQQLDVPINNIPGTFFRFSKEDAAKLADAALRAFAEPDDETVERIANIIGPYAMASDDDTLAAKQMKDVARQKAREVCQAIAGMAGEK